MEDRWLQSWAALLGLNYCHLQFISSYHFEKFHTYTCSSNQIKMILFMLLLLKINTRFQHPALMWKFANEWSQKFLFCKGCIWPIRHLLMTKFPGQETVCGQWGISNSAATFLAGCSSKGEARQINNKIVNLLVVISATECQGHLCFHCSYLSRSKKIKKGIEDIDMRTFCSYQELIK